MTKRNKIIYWIATAWLSLGMVSTGLVQLLRVKEQTDFILELGYPSYFLSVLGAAKILGTFVILVPKFRLLKEWAYAGFVFMMAGAILSHVLTGRSMNEVWPALFLLFLTFVSWHFRPAARKLTASLLN